MGFTTNAARKATYVTKNSGAEAACEWIMQHLDDPDLNDEHPDLRASSGSGTTSSNAVIDPAQCDYLTALGFTPHQARYSLKLAKGDANAAADWLFNNAHQVPPEESEAEGIILYKSYL